MPYPPSKEVPFRLEPERTALFVVDMQNDFVREGAPLEVPDARDTLEANRRAIAAARDLGMPVLYSKFLSGPEYTLAWEWSPMNGPEQKCCWKGHLRHYPDLGREADGSDVVDEIYPEPQDPIVEKYGYSAFFHTNALEHLRARHRDMLVVTGTVTQICVEDTVRSAFHHGLRTVVASDAVSSFDAELHRASLRGMGMKYARVLSVTKAFEELTGVRAT